MDCAILKPPHCRYIVYYTASKRHLQHIFNLFCLVPGSVIELQRPKHLIRQLGADSEMFIEVINLPFIGGFATGLADVVEQHG